MLRVLPMRQLKHYTVCYLLCDVFLEFIVQSSSHVIHVRFHCILRKSFLFLQPILQYHMALKKRKRARHKMIRNANISV